MLPFDCKIMLILLLALCLYTLCVKNQGPFVGRLSGSLKIMFNKIYRIKFYPVYYTNQIMGLEIFIGTHFYLLINVHILHLWLWYYGTQKSKNQVEGITFEFTGGNPVGRVITEIKWDDSRQETRFIEAFEYISEIFIFRSPYSCRFILISLIEYKLLPV